MDIGPTVDIAELTGDALTVGDHHRFLFAASYTLYSKRLALPVGPSPSIPGSDRICLGHFHPFG
jgi:hypothetical protein